MKLYQFVNEEYKTPKTIETEEEMDKVIEIIKKDCKPFLKEFNMFHNPIYRGSNKDEMSIQHMMKIRSRRKRKPKDTPKHLHDLMNDLFFKYHGWKPRSEGVFVTHDRSFAGQYGWQVFFFPKGKYQYLWHPQVKDIYATVRDIINDDESGIEYGLMPRDIRKEEVTDYLVEELERVIKNYQSTGYQQEQEKNEAMFKTWEYYMVSFDSQKEDRQFLRKLQEAI